MNRLQTIAVSAACAVGILAQAQNQMFSETNIWTCYDQVSKQNFKYQSSGNININGRNYQKLHMAAGNQPFEFNVDQSTLIGGLREDGQKIWFLPNGASEPFMLFDFSLQKGDQVQLNIFETTDGESFTVSQREGIVYKTEQVMLAGMNRKKLFISSPALVNALPESEHFRLDPFADVWIEGIGANSGLINRMPDWGTAVNDLPVLNCLTKSGSVIYSNTRGHLTSSNDPCFVIPETFNLDVYLGNAEDPTSLRELVAAIPKLAPNPVEDFARVSNLAPRANYKVEIFAMSGERISEEEAMSENGVLTLNMRNLRRGVYFIRLTSTGQNFTLRFAKI
ncbi:MAG: T9SS type A sorting domain-containing protein [Flavobacteriales bacterium]